MNGSDENACKLISTTANKKVINVEGGSQTRPLHARIQATNKLVHSEKDEMLKCLLSHIYSLAGLKVSVPWSISQKL